MNKMYVLTPTLSFEIAESDLQEMDWDEARQHTLTLGDRWRMPNKEELDEMFRLSQKAIGGFKHKNYWSSEGYNKFSAFAKSFITGSYTDGVSSKAPAPKYLVRLVRNI